VNSNDALAQSRPVDGTKWDIVDGYLSRRGRQRIVKSQEWKGYAALTATTAAAYRYAVASSDREVNITRAKLENDESLLPYPILKSFRPRLSVGSLFDRGKPLCISAIITNGIHIRHFGRFIG
jgi:hypothetical protein